VASNRNQSSIRVEESDNRSNQSIIDVGEIGSENLRDKPLTISMLPQSERREGYSLEL
jgi:hypothetical protein